MGDFSDPARKRREEIDELDDLYDRKIKEFRDLQKQVKDLQRKEELLDGEVADLEKEIDRLKREDEQQGVMDSIMGDEKEQKQRAEDEAAKQQKGEE